MSEQLELKQLSPVIRSVLMQTIDNVKEINGSTVSTWRFVAHLWEAGRADGSDLPQQLEEEGLNSTAWGQDIQRKLTSEAAEAGKNPFEPRSPQLSNELGGVLQRAIARAQARPTDTLPTAVDVWTELFQDADMDALFEKRGLSAQSRRALVRKWSGVEDTAEVGDIDPESSLGKYCIDLTAAARQGKLDPIIGRDDEIREAMNILQRRSKNNPIFVGEPGVGKTALVEGLAQRMMKNEVPETMKNKRLLSLDVGALVAGAKYKGDLEQRVKSLVKEIQDNAEVILFIDEIHTLVNSMGEASAVGQLLKPALARGELRCIGATTPEEYRLYLEKDLALERRFQKIAVLEPSFDDAVAILRGIKDSYALHHSVDITDSAVVAAVELSSRYITDRCLPDKAIDLMDAAAARVRTMLDSKPEQLDKLDRKLVQLKVQRETLKKEETLKGELDEDTSERLTALEQEIQTVEQDALTVETQWSKEKELHDNVHGIREELSQKQKELLAAQHEQNLVEMSNLQHGAIPELEKKLRLAKKAVRANPNPLMHDQVEANQIAEVVSRRTGIPVAKMNGGEQQKLADMESLIGAQVIGQPEAVEAVSDAVRRSRSGLSDPNKPIGSFLFMGPTGVGKTELTKVLSSFLFDRKDAMVRVDMSEFMEKHAVSRLIGAPPGYVGYEEGGMLTEAIRAHPYSVILLDEVEKAHPDVFNILLQVLDDGHLTDGKGRTVDFKNTVVIMTSNLGAGDIQELTAQNASAEEIKDSVMEHVKKYFRPEFINRLDETVVFRPLGREAIANIAQLQIKKVVKRMEDRKIEVDITPAAIAHLAEAGFDPLMGARPLKRAIQQELENPMAKKIVQGHVQEGDHLSIDAVGGQLTWNVSKPEVINEVENDEDDTASLSTKNVAKKAAQRRAVPAPRSKVKVS